MHCLGRRKSGIVGADRLMYLGNLLDQRFILPQRQRLGTVAHCFFRARVHFDDQAVGPDGDAGAGQGRDQIIMAGAVLRIDDHGQLGVTMQGRDDG